MSTLTHARRADRGDTPLPGDGERLPPRPRRRWLNPGSAALLAIVTGAIGFYVGVRVEKSNAASTSSASAAVGGFAARAAAATAEGAPTGGGARTGGGGFAAGALPGGGFGGGGGSAGTVASVDGRSLVLKETSGDTVKVKLTSATKVTKAHAVGRSRIRPGDTITISGVTDGKGTIAAAAVSDSGTSSSTGASSSAATSSSSSGSGSGSGSGVGSLFSSGG